MFYRNTEARDAFNPFASVSRLALSAYLNDFCVPPGWPVTENDHQPAPHGGGLVAFDVPSSRAFA